jgi:WD40 repeat protein
VAHLIREITKQRLRLVPDSSRSYLAENPQTEREFEMRVVNTSSVFASFQVELSVNGADPNSRIKWYTVEPEICSKKPPGDETKFTVVITKAPIPSTYENTIPITLSVFSVDSEAISDSQTLELAIEKPRRSLKVYLPLKDLKVFPGDKLDIPVLVYNLSPKFMQVALRLTDLDPNWFVQQEVVKTVQVDAGDSQEVTFCCSPPRQPTTHSRVYDFSINAEDQEQNTASYDGKIEVLPYGVVAFECAAPDQTIPASGSAKNRKSGVAEYPFQFHNHSNLKQQILLKIHESEQPATELAPLPAIEIEPGASVTTSRSIAKPRPWLGWGQRYQFAAVPVLTNAHSGAPSEPIYADPSVRTLDLEVRPMMPFLLQLLGGLLGLLVLTLLWWLSSPRSVHLAPVNSVRIISNETTVVSGSSDQTVRRWDINPRRWIVDRRRLSYRGTIADAEQTGKAVRVIREIPQREGQIAVGLENGEMQLWRVSSPQANSPTSISGSVDRVFDLDFTPDSRHLFSGHGSGFVRRWNRSGTSYAPAREQLAFGSAISALAVIDLSGIDALPPDRTLVAVAGQYNKFVLWDWERDRDYEVRYWNRTIAQASPTGAIEIVQPVIGKYDYINSLTVAKNAPVLATADNRGFITLWDVAALHQCTTSASTSPCEIEPLDQWQASRRGQSVRSIALSDDGCYLASTGDDGRVVLWLLRDRRRDAPHSTQIEAFPGTALRAVDIKRPSANYVLVAFNAPENQVRVYRQPVDPETSCPVAAQPAPAP